MPPPPRGPGIPFPPPLLWVAGWLLAWGLNQVLIFEIDNDGAGRLQTVAGAALLAGGLGTMFWGLATFWRARTAVIPNRPARQLVESGPFRFSRNPMYVGLTLLYSGLAVLLNLVWPIVVLPAVLVAVSRVVIRREERYLRDHFGQAYESYCGRVRRWV